MTNKLCGQCVNVDLFVCDAHNLMPGEKVLGSDFGAFPGGMGVNQAVAAARQGSSIVFIGHVGDYAFGFR